MDIKAHSRRKFLAFAAASPLLAQQAPPLLTAPGGTPFAIKTPKDALAIRDLEESCGKTLPIVPYGLWRSAEARDQFEEALRIRPDYPEAHNNLGVIMAREGDIKDAIGHYRMVLRDGRFWVQTANDLAWFRATCPVEKYRDGKNAIELSRKAVNLKKNSNRLDTLAAAYAEVAKYQEAVNTQNEAIELLKKDPDGEDKITNYNKHLESYKAGKPWRD